MTNEELLDALIALVDDGSGRPPLEMARDRLARPEAGEKADELTERMATINQCTVALIDLMDGAVMSKFATQRECGTYRAAILDAMNAVAGVLTNKSSAAQGSGQE